MNASRSIEYALDKETGEIVYADEIFKNTKDAFKLRKEFHKGNSVIHCCECGQELNVSTSKFDNLHFKHQPNALPCILKDGKLSNSDLITLRGIHHAKESPRHHFLKNLIASRLKDVEGVDCSSIATDDKFIVDLKEKRKPDVYCVYNGKEIVFEIQLSNLSLKYILDRYEFYRRKGIYLVWVLDNFNIHQQSQMEKDIKYLSKHQNYFRLDESCFDFKLVCEYKRCFEQSRKVHAKWTKTSLTLKQLTFDQSVYQIYYYNFEQEHDKLSNQIEEAQKEKLLLLRHNN